MNNKIADKITQRRDESHDLNQVAGKALGLGYYEGWGYQPASPGTQKNLIAVFGRTAFDKAVTEVNIRTASVALANALTKPDIQIGNLVVVCEGKFMYPLKQLFPGLKPKERVEVKADLEKKGFIFEGETPAKFEDPRTRDAAGLRVGSPFDR